MKTVIFEKKKINLKKSFINFFQQFYGKNLKFGKKGGMQNCRINHFSFFPVKTFPAQFLTIRKNFGKQTFPLPLSKKSSNFSITYNFCKIKASRF